MVDRANGWAATLDQSITTPRAPRGGARGAAAAAAAQALSTPATPTVPAWVDPYPDWQPPRTPGGRIMGGPHSYADTAFIVGGHSYATMHEFLQHGSEVAASYGRRDRYGNGQGPVDRGLTRRAEQMFNFTDPDTGMKAVVESVSPSGYGTRNNGSASVSVRGTIYDASGRQVGTFTRTMNSDGSVYHAYFEMNSSVQGGGFKTRWFKQLMDQYALHGFNKVTVSANIDVGGYAWAQTGFDFESSREAEQFLQGARDAMTGQRYQIGWSSRPAMGAAHRTAKAQRDLAALVRRHAAGERITAQDIAAIGKPARSRGGRNAMWFGKRLLLGSSWHGVLPL